MINDIRENTETKLQENAKLYDSYYDKPTWWFRFRYDTQVKKKTALHLLRKAKLTLSNKNVLEIGFGSGEVLFSFDTSCHIHGIEISSSAISLANKRAAKKGYSSYEFKQAEDESIPFQGESFDIVIASHVIEHVKDDGELLDEIERVLTPGGFVIFLIPINEHYIDPNHLRKYSSISFINLLDRHHFKKMVYSFENELLFHLVEKFYFEKYNLRWKLFGPVIAMIFNFPASQIPFSLMQIIDRLLISLGYKPRQFACILKKE
jgi:ubiquinone/menaquinone biosynthesis C-methylase UbiE